MVGKNIIAKLAILSKIDSFSKTSVSVNLTFFNNQIKLIANLVQINV